MKKIMIITTMVLVLSACQNNSNPYEIEDETLDFVQENVSNSFMPKSIIDDYEKENIIINSVCQATHDLGHENVDFIFQYSTDDDEYESEVALYKDENKVGRPGQYYAVEGSCEEVNYQ